jgi:valyl-tRNA synthetase
LECSLVSSVPSLCRVYLDLEKSADAMERMDKELNRIEKKSKKLQKKHDRVLKSYEKSSSSKTSVPEHVLETQRKDLSDLREQLDALSDSESSVRDVLRMFSE